MLSAFATELGAVIGDLVVPPEANEITAALTLLKGLPLEGAIDQPVRDAISPSARSAAMCVTLKGHVTCSS